MKFEPLQVPQPLPSFPKPKVLGSIVDVPVAANHDTLTWLVKNHINPADPRVQTDIHELHRQIKLEQVRNSSQWKDQLTLIAEQTAADSASKLQFMQSLYLPKQPEVMPHLESLLSSRQISSPVMSGRPMSRIAKS